MTVTHTPEETILWLSGRSLPHAEFARQLSTLLDALPGQRYLVNICESRHAFLLGFLAAAVRGQVTLLPPSRAPVALREITARYPDHAILTDETVAAAVRGVLSTPSSPFTTATNTIPTTTSAPADKFFRMSMSQNPVLSSDTVIKHLDTGSLTSLHVPNFAAIPAEREVAIVFTSGSTGMPEGHCKQWGALVRGANLLRRLLPQGDHETIDVASTRTSHPGHNVVATVPSQHMYGFETTVMLTLVSGGAVSDARPFFPQDIARELGAVPEPRLWVTTPTHLRACVAVKPAMPKMAMILSATAPLERELAQAAEDLWQAPLLEIYGCSETGSLASRRTTRSSKWQLHPGLHIQQNQGRTFVHGPDWPAPVPLQDHLELDDPSAGVGQFKLLGRAADLIKVAGKRASLADLTRQLLQIPGVIDGVVFVPLADARPAALVVAPSLDKQTVLAHLAERIDAVFLPRPLLMVPSLPRNESGKLPRAALLAAISHPTPLDS